MKLKLGWLLILDTEKNRKKMEKTRTKLRQEEFARAKIPSNHVAVELLRVEKDAKTHGGIYMGYLEDTTWEDENESHPADIASIVGRVVKLPPELYYNEDDPNNSMPWKTEMELEIGNMIFFNFIESLNATEIEVEGKIIRIIPYQDCYVTKRQPKPIFRLDMPMEYEFKDQIICLNGYVLLEQVSMTKLSELDVLSEQKIYEDRGIIRYFGTPNSAYLGDKYSDNIRIEAGQLAYFKPGYKPFLLERRGYFAHFEGEKLFWCTQRRRLVFAV